MPTMMETPGIEEISTSSRPQKQQKRQQNRMKILKIIRYQPEQELQGLLNIENSRIDSSSKLKRKTKDNNSRRDACNSRNAIFYNKLLYFFTQMTVSSIILTEKTKKIFKD
jgi:hypothetical protein